MFVVSVIKNVEPFEDDVFTSCRTLNHKRSGCVTSHATPTVMHFYNKVMMRLYLIILL
jgi:hypothetical protein